jgi:hypothetical protein
MKISTTSLFIPVACAKPRVNISRPLCVIQLTSLTYQKPDLLVGLGIGLTPGPGVCKVSKDGSVAAQFAKPSNNEYALY